MFSAFSAEFLLNFFQVPKVPQAPPVQDKLLDPNPGSLPTHTGIKYVARSLFGNKAVWTFVADINIHLGQVSL